LTIEFNKRKINLNRKNFIFTSQKINMNNSKETNTKRKQEDLNEQLPPLTYVRIAF